METVGLIETKGLIPAIISADAMLKAANVRLLDKVYIGSGLVTISITGDVGAVRAAVDAGVAAVRDINIESLVSEHVIPRPHMDLQSILVPEPAAKVESKEETEEVVLREEAKAETEMEEDEVEEIVLEEETEERDIDLDNIDSKEEVDNIFKELGKDEGLKALKGLRVVELRNLARKYEEFEIKGREISKAGKNALIDEFEKYYNNNDV